VGFRKKFPRSTAGSIYPPSSSQAALATRSHPANNPSSDLWGSKERGGAEEKKKKEGENGEIRRISLLMESWLEWGHNNYPSSPAHRVTSLSGARKISCVRSAQKEAAKVSQGWRVTFSENGLRKPVVAHSLTLFCALSEEEKSSLRRV